MSDTTMDPKAIAQAVAVTVSDEDGQVGDFVEAIDLGRQRHRFPLRIPSTRLRRLAMVGHVIP